MANDPFVPAKRLFPRQRFTSKLNKEGKIRTPLDKWLKRGQDRIPIEGTINGERFIAKLEFWVDPELWFDDVDITPEGHYEIWLDAKARYMLRRLTLRPGMKVEVDFVYAPEQYAKDEIARQKINAYHARKREEKRKAEKRKR